MLPRNVNSGIEDADLSDWCYWDDSTVKGDKGCPSHSLVLLATIELMKLDM